MKSRDIINMKCFFLVDLKSETILYDAHNHKNHPFFFKVHNIQISFQLLGYFFKYFMERLMFPKIILIAMEVYCN